MTEKKSVVFGGGCFWCTEAVFLQLTGVLAVTPGYAGGPPSRTPVVQGEERGRAANQEQAPTYAEVSTGRTGHAEVIRIEYDPTAISFRKLLEVFFASHDPTTINRQGADVGPQYRSIILYRDEDQKRAALRYIAELALEKTYSSPIVTEVRALDRFYPAEAYHRDFYAKNPEQSYSQSVIAPKVAKTRETFKDILRDSQ